jgi:prevent-host-death family protein
MEAKADRSPDEPIWRLQDAQARLGDIVRLATNDGPQHLSIEGEAVAVVLSEQDYRRIAPARASIIDHILGGEAWSDELVDAINERPRELDRDIPF